MPGATYFFTVNTYHRQALLTDPRCRESLRNAIEKVRLDLPFDIIAWVLMPDHLQAIWQLPQSDTEGQFACYGQVGYSLSHEYNYI